MPYTLLAAVKSVATLAYNLADVTYQELCRAGCNLAAPQMADFEAEPFVALRHFLDAAESAGGEGRTIVWMLDEFEGLEDKWRAGVFPDDLLWSLRSIGQHRTRFVLLFAGSHTLEDLTRQYWSPVSVHTWGSRNRDSVK